MAEFNEIEGGLGALTCTSFVNIPVAYAFKVTALNTSFPTKPGNNKRLITQKDIAAGEEIINSDTLLLASKEGWGCIACNDPNCMGYCDPFRFYFADLSAVLAAVSKISIDTGVSEAIIRLLVKYVALKKTENPKLKELLEKVFELDGRDSCDNKKDLNCAEKVYNLLPKSHQNYVSKEKLQLLVRIFLVNCIVVPHLNGVGLYPIIVLVDHSCKENCHYECIGDRIILTALTPIAKDQGLTLNFINPYNPKSKRQALIKSQFQYTCGCELCVNESARDETRAFVCKKCPFVSEEECGIVCPKGFGHFPIDWSCHKCNEPPTKDLFQEYLKVEEANKDADSTLLKVTQILKPKLIHPYHHIVYKALQSRVSLLSNMRPVMCEKYISWILAANARFHVAAHPIRAEYFDLLGQSKNLNGDGKGCKEAFVEASNILDRICSKKSPQLALAKQKTVNPEKVEISLWYPISS